MPELPEVHTIVADLALNIKDCLINQVEIDSGYKVTPNNEFFSQSLKGTTVEKVGRIGKNIVIKLSSGKFLLFHLAMTGRLLLRNLSTPKEPHQRVQLKLQKQTENRLLRFCDVRMFGKAGIYSREELKILKQKYGPDISTDSITADTFHNRLKSKRTIIKTALLEQSIIAGLGNIYVTDSLWMAGIHPEKKTSELTQVQVANLLKSAKEIIAEGILHRGSTLPDEAYVDIFGKAGTHQNFFRIYGKRNCPTCKSKVEFKKIAGRGTYFCPVCQK